MTDIELTSDRPSIPVNSLMQFKAIAEFSDKHKEDVTTKARWSSEDESILTIDATGKAIGNAAGKASVSVEHSGIAKSLSIEVTP